MPVPLGEGSFRASHLLRCRTDGLHRGSHAPLAIARARCADGLAHVTWARCGGRAQRYPHLHTRVIIADEIAELIAERCYLALAPLSWTIRRFCIPKYPAGSPLVVSSSRTIRRLPPSAPPSSARSCPSCCCGPPRHPPSCSRSAVRSSYNSLIALLISLVVLVRFALGGAVLMLHSTAGTVPCKMQ